MMTKNTKETPFTIKGHMPKPRQHVELARQEQTSDLERQCWLDYIERLYQ